MARRNIFVEVSGDEFYKHAFLKFIKKLTKKAWVVIGIGGGTQVNKIFAQLGFPINKHGPMGHETKTFKQRQTQRDVIERNQMRLQDFLAKNGIYVAVELPFFTIGTVLCPQNGDQMVRAAYLGFDEIYRVTTNYKRAEKKAAIYKDLPKIKVLYEDEGVLKEFIAK